MNGGAMATGQRGKPTATCAVKKVTSATVVARQRARGDWNFLAELLPTLGNFLASHLITRMRS